MTPLVRVAFPGPQGVPGPAGPTSPELVAAAGAAMKDVDTLGVLKADDTYHHFYAQDDTKLTNLDQLDSYTMVIGDEATPITTGTSKATWRVPFDFNLIAVEAYVGDGKAPAGSGIMVDLLANGTSFLSTKITIDDGVETSFLSTAKAVANKLTFKQRDKVTANITQVGSSVAGAGLKVVLYYERVTALMPTFSDNFDTFTARYKRIAGFNFGENAETTADDLAITNFEELLTYFEEYERGTDKQVINKELQRYKSVNSNNFKFVDKGLELIATFPQAATLPGYISKKPSAAVAYARQIPIADTSAIRVGQVVGFGAEHYDNMHQNNSYVLKGAITAGDQIAQTFVAYDGSFADRTVAVTAAAGESHTSFARKLVDAINADIVMGGKNITASVLPDSPGGYCIHYPKYTGNLTPLGRTAYGSFRWLGITNSVPVAAASGLDGTIANPQAGGSNVGSVSWAKTVAYQGVEARTVTITCTTAGASGAAKVSIAATGTISPFTTLTNQTVTNGSPLTLPNGARINPTLLINMAVGDVYTIALTPPLTNGFNQFFFVSYVVAKTANSVILNHPVSLTTESTVIFSPSRVFSLREDAWNATGLQIGPGLEEGIEIGSAIQLSYQDNNLRTINSTTSGIINVEAAVYGSKGLLVVVLPFYKLSATATPTDENIQFASVPAGIKPGMCVSNYFGATYSNGAYYVVSVTPTSVRLDRPMTGVGTGSTIVFHAPIDSGQIWSKFLMAPGFDGRSVLASEITVKFPNAGVLAAWIAWWVFSATDDPNPITGRVAGTNEYDFTDTFNYWNNNSLNNINPAGGTTIYTYAGPLGSAGTANNLGTIERKLQCIQTQFLTFFYIDNQLIRVATGGWNTAKRGQFGFNFAVGSCSQNFNSNGFWPVDLSTYLSGDAKSTIRAMKFWGDPDNLVQFPQCRTKPIITGTITVGGTLTCAVGGWLGSNNVYTYQWLKDGVALAGQTGSTLLVTDATPGVTYSCTVTATNVNTYGISVKSNQKVAA